MNRKHNAGNPFQGESKRVLCVCSAGLLRSPTAAWVLSNDPFNFNTRAAGLDAGHALIVVDDVLIHWADEIVCMDKSMMSSLMDMGAKEVTVLDIPDNFAFKDPALIRINTENYKDA